MSRFIAYDILWDFDEEEILEAIDRLTYQTAAEILGLPKERYANMTTSERHDVALDVFHHRPGAADELFGLPEEVEIPQEFGITSEQDDFGEVTDWLSDEYGFFIKGYRVKRGDGDYGTVAV